MVGNHHQDWCAKDMAVGPHVNQRSLLFVVACVCVWCTCFATTGRVDALNYRIKRTVRAVAATKNRAAARAN